MKKLFLLVSKANNHLVSTTHDKPEPNPGVRVITLHGSSEGDIEGYVYSMRYRHYPNRKHIVLPPFLNLRDKGAEPVEVFKVLTGREL